MSAYPVLCLGWADWLMLFAHYLMLSLLSVGSVRSTAPEMYRFLVEQQGWLNGAQFASSITIAQVAPGPNVLFVGLLGWNVGMNAGGIKTGLLGLSVSLLGILLPSTSIGYLVTRWGHRNRELRAVRAFKQGMAPIVVFLLISTGWVLAIAQGGGAESWPLWLLTAISALVMASGRIHFLWILAVGAVLGVSGFV